MNPHIKTLFILFPLIVILSFSGIYLSLTKKAVTTGTQSSLDNGEISISTAREVAGYIKAKDFVSLSNFVDSKYGLLFSPYYSSGGNQGRNLTKDQVKNFFSDTTQKMWGYEDGSGLAISFTNNQYYEKYIYPVDFVTLGKESLNNSLVNGNTPPLDEVLSSLYSTQISQGNKIQYVEYYITGLDPKYEGMDWESLALVFMRLNGSWRLVGVLHNQWTI